MIVDDLDAQQSSAESALVAPQGERSLDDDATTSNDESEGKEQDFARLRLAVEAEKERANKAEVEVADLLQKAENYRHSLEEQTLLAVDEMNKFLEATPKLMAPGEQMSDKLSQLKGDIRKHTLLLSEALQRIQQIGEDLKRVNSARKTDEIESA